ncbi:MAG: LysM peptidoglycan-binding domain-containing protein [Bacteroidetes bacterium]|nr:LysM peptidoglycan-binding domain-containing protein [Bacteroidota bacterium]MBU1720216.1 LysM peptidoglycan-binding domain-containing protein [Bacteroidota bacterium]
MSATTNKLKIESYQKSNFTGKVGDFTAKFNPAKLQHEFAVHYDLLQAFGTSGTEGRYNKSLPEKITFELLFDDTILSPGSTAHKPSVNTEIQSFRDTVFTYNGTIHRPNYLKLIWGEFFFKGQVSSLNFTYNAFSPQGEPLKVKADVVFIAVKDTASRLSAENKSSPDLTHIYQVKEGDTLPMLAHRIYGNPAYYLEIAQVNNLDSFRVLKPGDRIILPPIEK